MNTAVNVNTGVSVPASGMSKFFRWLLHPLFLALLGVIAISALVWWVGPADRDRRDPPARSHVDPHHRHRRPVRRC